MQEAAHQKMGDGGGWDFKMSTSPTCSVVPEFMPRQSPWLASRLASTAGVIAPVNGLASPTDWCFGRAPAEVASFSLLIFSIVSCIHVPQNLGTRPEAPIPSNPPTPIRDGVLQNRLLLHLHPSSSSALEHASQGHVWKVYSFDNGTILQTDDPKPT